PTLTPSERLPLILSAMARKDEVELDRLIRTAPRVAFTVADHLALAEGLNIAAMLYQMEMLESSCLLLRLSAMQREWCEEARPTCGMSGKRDGIPQLVRQPMPSQSKSKVGDYSAQK